jgi:hypothetical protein
MIIAIKTELNCHTGNHWAFSFLFFSFLLIFFHQQGNFWQTKIAILHIAYRPKVGLGDSKKP